MRLFFILVVTVSVVVVTADISKRNLHVGLCHKEDVECQEFAFTAAALRKIRANRDFHVVLTVEESKHPQVTFDLVVINKEKVLHEFKRVASLKPREQRIVGFRVSDFEGENTVQLGISGYPKGIRQLEENQVIDLSVVTSDTEVILQTDKMAYASDDVVKYRAVIVDRFKNESHETSKFFGMSTTEFRSLYDSSHRVNFPRVEVPDSGILMGNFPYSILMYSAEGSVASDAASTPTASSVARISMGEDNNSDPYSGYLWMELQLNREEIDFWQSKIEATITVKISNGYPFVGQCDFVFGPTRLNATYFKNSKLEWNSMPKRTWTFEGESITKKLEFDVVKELKADWGERNEVDPETVDLALLCNCSHEEFGLSTYKKKHFKLHGNLFELNLLDSDAAVVVRPGNISHPKPTLLLKFSVKRFDGMSVEEDDPRKGLHVAFFLSNDTSEKLQISPRNYSLAIPKDGIVKLEIPVEEDPHFTSKDAVELSVGSEKFRTRRSLKIDAIDFHPHPILEVVDTTRSFRRGEEVSLRFRSRRRFQHLNAVMSSHKAIYSSQTFSFNLSEEKTLLDEVIKLRIPHNFTEASLNVIVYGIGGNQLSSTGEEVYVRSVNIKVAPNSGPQFIRVVDTVDEGMSTKVILRLEGMEKNSVVSFVARKMGSLEVGGNSQRHLCENKKNILKEGNEFYWNEVNVVSSVPVERTLEGKEEPVLSICDDPLIFFDIERSNSTEDYEPFFITRNFDRLTQFGSYIFSAVTHNPRTGVTFIPESAVVSIPPPPLIIAFFARPSMFLGETVHITGKLTNPTETHFQGNVTLGWAQGLSNEVIHQLADVKPQSYRILEFEVTPLQEGDLHISLGSNSSSIVTVMRILNVLESPEHSTGVSSRNANKPGKLELTQGAVKIKTFQ